MKPQNTPTTSLPNAEKVMPQGEELKKAIRNLCREKNAVIMAHYYTEADVQEVADFVGDSLALA
ncbi:MAG: quinolinate synthase NadA, partial [Bacteroidaceae bacterium]|nr:quinolinate synthase NadA [Bacteroidaceae bacterium]